MKTKVSMMLGGGTIYQKGWVAITVTNEIGSITAECFSQTRKSHFGRLYTKQNIL